MIPWRRLACAEIPGSRDALTLWQRGPEFAIRVGVRDLMTSREHRSEEALAERALARCAQPAPRVLIGGLGLGYTLAAVLRGVGPRARVVVAELVPAVVEWNRGPLGPLAGHPLDDSRARVHVGDVVGLLRERPAAWDCVLLDVDDGPKGLTRGANARLYDAAGLALVCEALRPGGILAVWSSGPDRSFPKRLHAAGFRVEELRERTRPGARRAAHVLWLGTR